MSGGPKLGEGRTGVDIRRGMKVCLLCYRGNPYCGGQGIYIHYLSRALRNLGHEVQVLSGPPYPQVVEGVELHRLESLNLYETTDSIVAILPRLRYPLNLYEFMAVLAGTFPEPLTFSLRAYRKLRQLRAEQKVDVVHDNQCLGYGLLLMKRLQVPVVATIHHPVPIDRDIELAYAPNRRHRFRMKRWYSFCTMQGRVSRRLDRVISVSRVSAEDTERIFQIPREKLRVVHNGIDGDLFRRDDSVPKQPNSIITTDSGESHIKGVAHLLKALQLLRGELEVKLTVVGRGEPNGLHMGLAREYGLEDLVTITGRIGAEELARRYSASEIAVVPSLYEGFGLPAAEAMACELPVIASMAGALPEVVGGDGEAGFLVPPADPAALAAAIKRLFCDEHLRRRMGEAGRRRVERNFTWEQAAKRTVQVYEELL